ncbi:hemerythrin domain-containing protein [Jatrophihabitans sp. DSM 45814]
MTEAGTQTILEVLTSDHRGIRSLLETCRTSVSSENGQAERELLVSELVRHFVAEEQFLYPLIRDNIDGGDAIADDAFHADRRGEKAMRSLEDHDETIDEVTRSLDSLDAQLAEHIRLLETELFPQLAGKLTPEELRELGDQALGAEQLAPTRPRRFATESAPLNKVASAVEGWVDKVRDSYGHRGTEPTNVDEV